MRYILLAVPFLAALTCAQLGGLPSCAQNAAAKGVQDSGCGATDVTCICSKALSSPSLQSAVQAACSPAEVCQTVTFAQGICTGQTIPGADQCAKGGSLSSVSSSAAASSTAASNSTAAAGGTSSASSGSSVGSSSSSMANSGSSMTSGSMTSSATGSATAGQTTAASGTAASASTAAAGKIEVGGFGLAVLGFGAAFLV